MSGVALDARPIGIFGGTFDPIHLGHLRTGFELLQSLQLSELRWIPVGNPGHREPPLAAAALRLEMVRAAVAGQPGFVLDEREVRRSGASYTVDTLEELHAEHPARPRPREYTARVGVMLVPGTLLARAHPPQGCPPRA